MWLWMLAGCLDGWLSSWDHRVWIRLLSCGTHSAEGRRPLGQPAGRRRYFSVKSAFTWAVTLTVCGVNSSVGAGAASAFIAIERAIIGTGRIFSNVSTDA